MKEKKRQKRKWILIGAGIVAAGLVITLVIRFQSYKEKVNAGGQKQSTVRVVKMDLTKSISATGTLSSAKTRTVDAKVSEIAVKKVLVAVGDSVKKGDSLVTFEKEDLQDALQDAKNNLADTQSSADREVSSAQAQVSDARENYAAEKARQKKEVTAAKKALAEARKTASQLEKQVKKAKNQQEKASLEQQLTQAKEKKEQAQASYDTAVSNQSSSNRQNQSSITNAENAVETAKSNRTKNVKEAQKQVDEAQDNLDQCAVTAPMDGLVTAVNVEDGDSYSGGDLVQIEDTSAYTVTTTVDEYDISDVKEGQKVVILTEATGEDELEGEITFVAPSTSSTSDSSTSGSGTPSGDSGSSSSSSSGYEVKIKVKGTDDRLKLGMTAKCSIILEEAEDVLAVPYDAVNKKKNGNTITVMEEGSSEQKEISVTLGMESDYYVEVQGDDLQEGMQVVIPSDEVDASESEEKTEQTNGKGFGNSVGGFGGPDGSGEGHRGGGNGSGGPGGAPAGAPGN